MPASMLTCLGLQAGFGLHEMHAANASPAAGASILADRLAMSLLFLRSSTAFSAARSCSASLGS